ncbi:MAG: hypothetical protein P1S60_14765, partial [Anaerolineae bacterium]|nr:hypothetical protein [Anaerolineae bacterium]
MFVYDASASTQMTILPRLNGAVTNQLAILLAALGLLISLVIIGSLVFILIKILNKKSVTPNPHVQSKPDDQAEDSDGVLPAGTALKDGLYEIDAFVDVDQGVQEYRARRTHALYLCPQCSAELGNEVSAFCRVCGNALGVVPPVFPTYTIRVSDKPFTQAQQIIGMNLMHPNIILPLDCFVDETLGSSLHFLVEPFDPQLQVLTHRNILPVTEILTIGIQLAEGMAYLHDYSVLINKIMPD